MKRQNVGGFGAKILEICDRKKQFPISGQIELTYRCNLDCIHCYCKGSEDKKRELTTAEWKKILDEIHKEGCLYLCFTGGEPLIRDDFLELYAYAKAKGFLITIFTNGTLFTREIIEYLEKSSPYSIEITLNGMTKEVYEAITQVPDSFEIAISNIKELARKDFPLVLKSNCLKQNKDEIVKVKVFTDDLLGKSKRKWKFKYDPMIYPRLNGDKIPCNYRLSFEELLEVKKQDPDIWEEYEKWICATPPDLKREKDCLYRCTVWMNQFSINPYGRLKFCVFSGKFSVDLRTTSFKEGFYNIFPQVSNEKFKTNSQCRNCHLRLICYHCPARAYLEKGDEEALVDYFCRLAKKTAKQINLYGRRKAEEVTTYV